MTALANILPNRPIRLTKTGVWPGIFQYLGALMLLGVAVFIGIWQGPGILEDWTISQNPVVVQDAEITDGECSTSKGIFVDCSAHVSYEVKGKSIERDVALTFLDFHEGDYEVDVVRSAAQPSKATLSLGLDMLWNRTITVSALVLMLAVFGVALFRSGLQADRNRRMAGRPSQLTPVAVPVLQINKVVGGKVFQYQYGANKKGRALLTTSRFRSKDSPLWLEEGGTHALAVLPQGATVPVLLDENLNRLDLSEPERATAREKLNQMATQGRRQADSERFGSAEV